jgi:hypothetical protein
MGRPKRCPNCGELGLANCVCVDDQAVAVERDTSRDDREYGDRLALGFGMIDDDPRDFDPTGDE